MNLLLTLCIALARSGLARVVDTSGNSQHLSQYSLSNILDLQIPPSQWHMEDSCQLHNGRFILTPQKNTGGALWLEPFQLNQLGKDAMSFTLEWTFRSINYVGPSKGGIAFWLLKQGPGNDGPGHKQQEASSSLVNGPSQFNGLQLLVNNNGQFGDALRAQLNDGTKKIDIESIDSATFASCLVQYQDSSVPITLRLSYDPLDNHALKLQINNKICFQTRKVKLWDSASANDKLAIGVTASNDRDTTESFEVLKMDLFSGLTDDTYIPNVNQMEQAQVVRKIINTKTGEEKLKLKDPLENEHSNLNNFQLFQKLDQLEGKIIANDINSIADKLAHATTLQEALVDYMHHLMKAINLDPAKGMTNSESKANKNDNQDFSEFTNMNEKLQKIIEEQEKIREQNQIKSKPGNSAFYRSVTFILFLWLVPLILIMGIMGYHTFKIRQEVMNTKLL